MKKTAAILLVIIFLFNLFGYRILIDTLHTKAEKKMEALIDEKDYNEEALLEIRVAMNMPYQQRYTEYERHYGQISIEGKEYTYVKRKIEGDTLILKCIPDQQSTTLNQIEENITLANSGHHTPQQIPGKSLVKIFKIDGEVPVADISPSISFLNSHPFSFYSDLLPVRVSKGLERPPQSC